MVKIVKYIDIPLEELEIGRYQVRSRDVGKDIDELADSIKKVGLLEPIVVAPQGLNGKYEVILGQRRYLAHRELGLETIRAGVLNQHIKEIEAKVLSVTENLVRRDLNRNDLIDVCTYLYKHYSSMKAVAEHTGLSSSKVSEFIKYERLIPELREAVDSGEADLKSALRAQDALSTEGDPDPLETVKLAKSMSPMSNAQQKNIQDKLVENPTTSVDEVIERAKSGEKVTQISVTLGHQIHKSLVRFAKVEGTTIPEAAAQLIENGLTSIESVTDGDLE